MSSSSNEKIDRYDFFNNIDKYITEVKKIHNSIYANTSIDDCNNFSNQHNYLGNREKLKSLCNRFAILNKFLKSIETNGDNKCKFLNYWLNSELSQTWFSENNSISHVYDGIESQLYDNSEYSVLECEYCNINKVELHKMTILYNLYEKYSELKTIIEATPQQDKLSLLPFSNECCTDYIQAKYICNDDKNNESKFCKKLKDFENEYDELYRIFDGKRIKFSNDLIKLSECPNPKIITTAVTGSIIGLIPLAGILYKFTPMGQVFRSKIGLLNNDIRNTDEDITKISLMEQENEPLNFQQGTYNIKYQSL